MRRMNKLLLGTVLLLVALLSTGAECAFVSQKSKRTTATTTVDSSSKTAAASTVAALFAEARSQTEGSSNKKRHVLNVVLFGVGDLRVDDHVGLATAMESLNENDDDSCSSSSVLPLFVLTDDMVRALPGAVAHTVNTVALLENALVDLDASLRQVHPQLGLHVGDSLWSVLSQKVPSLEVDRATVVRIHVCDLGEADNAMGYGALGGLDMADLDPNDNGGFAMELVPWNNRLRNEPYEKIHSLPDSFPDYDKQYASGSGTIPSRPIAVPSALDLAENQIVSVDALPVMPTQKDLLERFRTVLDLDEKQCQAATNTGLYATHWGGLDACSVGSRSVLDTLDAFVTACQEDDTLWSRHDDFPKIKRNDKSLEHAAMVWQLDAAGGERQHGTASTTANNNNNNIKSENWLPGESMTRYLAAPLFFGAVSPRRIWHAARDDNFKLFNKSALRKLVEGREWHNLLAERNIKSGDPAYNSHHSHLPPDKEGGSFTRTVYKYWRYHGFLCRYAETDFKAETSSSSNQASSAREGILLVHGFGASGSQWNKAMSELDKLSTTALCQGIAPDLIGFGHSEKPGISYSGYMWDAQMMEFAKEICMHKNKWKSYVTGGNSIGGFTSMSLAACDSATATQVSSSGAPGTDRCTGLVLMNSAGPVKTQEECETEIAAANDIPLDSVAQRTASDALPVCNPPPRLVGLGIGNVLLGYLRPRIQSICVNLYPTNPAAVDDALCAGIRRDSLDPGAINVMMAGAKLPAPRSANELLAADFGAARPSSSLPNHKLWQESSFRGPVLIAQGVLDPLNDAKDRMERYAALRPDICTDAIQAGHCPHDELPADIAQSIARWMPSRTSIAAKANVISFASKS